MTRSKEPSILKYGLQRHGSFAFRRIQGRELYEPSGPESSPARSMFRVRISQVHRRAS